jgi:WD40 repeat protein/uncharacterized caspase-like protein
VTPLIRLGSCDINLSPQRFTQMSIIRLIAFILVVIITSGAGILQTSASGRGALEIVPPLRHTGDVQAGAFAVNGKLAATGDDKGTILLWGEGGRLLRVFHESNAAVTSLSFSPDGRRLLATEKHPFTTRLWNVESGKIEAVLSKPSERLSNGLISPLENILIFGGVSFAAFIEQGNKVVVAWPGELKIWDPTTGSLKSAGLSKDQIKSMVIHPSRPIAFTGDIDGFVRVWDLRNGVVIRVIDAHSKPKESGKLTVVDCLAVSPDGATIVTCGGESSDGIRFWDWSNGTLKQTLAATEYGRTNLAYSPDGHLLYGVGIGGLSIWDLQKGQLLPPSEKLASGGTTALAIDPLGKTLIISGGFVDATSRKAQASISNYMDGKLLVTKAGDVVSDFGPGALQWNLKTGVPTAWGARTALKGDGDLVGLRRDGGYTNVSDYFEWIVRSVDGSVTGTLPSLKVRIDAVDAADADSVIFVSSRPAKAVMERNIRTGATRTVKTLEDIDSPEIAVSPNGKTIAMYNDRVGIQIIDRATGRDLRTIKPWKEFLGVFALVFSADGNYVFSGGIDDDIRQWDARSGQLFQAFKGHSGPVNSLAFLPDGRRMASASWDGTVRVWDLKSHAPLTTMLGHLGRVRSVIAPSNNRLVSWGEDGTLRVWDTESGKLLCTFFQAKGKKGAEYVSITPEGYFAATSPGAASSMSLVRGLEAVSVNQTYQALYRPDLVAEKLAGDPTGEVQKAAEALDLETVITSGAPPRIDRMTAEPINDSYRVRANIAAQAGGLGRAEWRVNGVTRGIETQLPAGATTIERSFALEEGKNVVDVRVYNAKNLIASPPRATQIDVAAGAAPQTPRLFILTIGINDYYDSRIKLNFAATDATSVGEAFGAAGKALYGDVVLKRLIDKQANRQGIDKAFDELGSQMRPKDVFVLFIAGHGKTVAGRYYFIPQDFRYRDETSIEKEGIGQDLFQEWLARIPAKKSILLYDTCESGTLTSDKPATRGLERVAALDRMTNAMGRTILSASTDDTPALEGYNGHGVFTYSLLAGLDGADKDGNNVIDITELASFVDAQVPEISQKAFNQRQVPQMRIVGSNFPLLAKYAAKLEGAEMGSPTKPTHVTIQTAEVKDAPNGAVVEKLAAGSQVTLLETANGWSVIARGGKRLGYVADVVIAPLQ